MRYTPSCHVLLVLAVAACRIVVGPVGTTGGGLLLVHAGLPAVDVGVTLNDTSIASLEDLKSDLLQSFQPGAAWSQEARLLGCDVTVRMYVLLYSHTIFIARRLSSLSLNWIKLYCNS